jgi:F-type H+-transporting ATPase subunit epsilon
MRLRVTTPASVVVDEDGVRSVRAEDATGSFGILPGHASFLTVLAVSVVCWHDSAGIERYVALRGGALRVSGGRFVDIATREAVCGEDLEALERRVLRSFREEVETELQARTAAARMHAALIRHIQRYLHPADGGHRVGAPAGSPEAPDEVAP